MEKLAQPFLKFRFQQFEFDARTGELKNTNGKTVRLAQQPAEILLALLERPGNLITREELARRLWPAGTFVDFDRSLNKAINKLREALHDPADHSRFIETFPRRGYRLIASVGIDASDQHNSATVSVQPTPAGIDPGSEPQPKAVIRILDRPAPRRSRPRWAIALGLIGLLAIAIGSNWSSLRTRVRGGPSRTKIGSLAVLPLENLSHDPEQEYLADGMTDALITELGKISALRVISRSSVLVYKGKHVSTPQIARDLNVEAILEGTVVRVGDRVRVSANLIQVSPERHLWSESYERDLRDVLVLQDDVALSIVREIKVELTPQEQRPTASARPVNPEAYESYLRGRYYWNRRTPEALKKALDYLNEAVAKDQTYALAYAGLADCYLVLAHQGVMAADVAQPKARMAAERALELNPLLAEAHTALAAVRETYDFDWVGAESEFKRALELNPNYANGHHWYGLLLMNLGRVDEARQQIELARGLDPLSLQIQANLGALYEHARQFDQAMEVARKVAQMDPTFAGGHFLLSQLYRQKQMYREAAAELQKGLLASNERERAALFDKVTDEASFRRAVTQGIALRKERSKTRYVSPMWFADQFVELQDNEQALAWLEKAYRERDEDLIYLKTDPSYDRLRSDPRFQDLLLRVGLPP